MFGIQAQLTATPKRLEKATDKGAYKTLRHAAFSIRKSAIESMVFAKGPSKPGSPPHAHTGRLRRSILVAQDDKGEVVVGPSYSRVKVGGRPPWLAKMLEFGGVFGRPIRVQRRQNQRVWAGVYPARPFMQPALERNLARFHREWKGAIS